MDSYKNFEIAKLKERKDIDEYKFVSQECNVYGHQSEGKKKAFRIAIKAFVGGGGYFIKLKHNREEEERERAEQEEAQQRIFTKIENEISIIYCTIFDRYQKENDERIDLHEKIIEVDATNHELQSQFDNQNEMLEKAKEQIELLS